MDTTSCRECGAEFSAEDQVCPSCGAERASGGVDEIEAAADDLRGDQWRTYILLAGGGLLVAGILVGSIVLKVFSGSDGLPESGPAYADTREAMRSYLHDEVLERVAMKYSTKSSPAFECSAQSDLRARGSGVYEADVRCESSEKVVSLTVDVIHDGESVRWDSRVRKSNSK